MCSIVPLKVSVFLVKNLLSLQVACQIQVNLHTSSGVSLDLRVIIRLTLEYASEARVDRLGAVSPRQNCTVISYRCFGLTSYCTCKFKL